MAGPLTFDDYVQGACEAIYTAHEGYWPSEVERRNLRTAIAAVLQQVSEDGGTLSSRPTVSDNAQSDSALPGMFHGRGNTTNRPE